jgi:glycine/D-amino acid oxidase-like deaminating enzyme
MRPSWFSSFKKEQSGPALRLLDELYGVQDLIFRVGPGRVTVHWCDPRSILSEKPLRARVQRIAAGGSGWEVSMRNQPSVDVPLVVVAAGIWTTLLAPVEGDLVGQAGAAFLWADEYIEKPFVRPWAPYRQLVAFNRGDGLWVGDGTAIKRDNWTEARAVVCEERCTAAVGLPNKPRRLFGVRPYSRERPCYLREQRPGFWVATGGAKNGTLAAAWCAHEIIRKTV